MSASNYSRSISARVREVVGMLVRGEYLELEELTNAMRLRASDIQAGVEEYGRRLVLPPNSAYDNIDAIAVVGSSPSAYSIRFRLYTEEDGASDLELRLTLVDHGPSGGIQVQLDDLLVA